MSMRNIYEISFLLVLMFGVLSEQALANLDLRKLEEKKNFIRVKYKDETKYPDGFENQYRQGIDHIEVETEEGYTSVGAK